MCIVLGILASGNSTREGSRRSSKTTASIFELNTEGKYSCALSCLTPSYLKCLSVIYSY